MLFSALMAAFCAGALADEWLWEHSRVGRGGAGTALDIGRAPSDGVSGAITTATAGPDARPTATTGEPLISGAGRNTRP